MKAAGFEVNSFYGKRLKIRDKTWKLKLAKLENRAETYKCYPVKSLKRQRVSRPVPVFRRFPRQQMALDFAQTCYQDVHVFAEEKGTDGRRDYVVATLVDFWSKYRELPIQERHYYEVIPQGAACRLYFDLEFKTHLNPSCNGSDMVNIFVKYVCHFLFTKYNISCNRSHVLDLDSSTSSKFSRHLIFHLPDAAFKDNIHAGNFVRHICSLLVEKLRGINSSVDPQHWIPDNQQCAHDQQGEMNTTSQASAQDRVLMLEDLGGVSLQELQKLSISDEKGELSVFVDEGVYTKNRNFRLYLSTKLGKITPLTVGKENEFKYSYEQGVADSFPADPHYQIFLDSLVSNISTHGDVGKVRVLIFEDCRKLARSSRKNGTAVPTESCDSGYERSPYPLIDQFISRNISKGGVQGQIRRWVCFPKGKLITYDIVKNHWCENIGRPHKSNHIMMVVDLKMGIYYQKCHDPDCKKIDFRSPGLPIPDEINPFHMHQEGGDYWEEGEEHDAELCRVATQSEEIYQAALLTDSELCPESNESPCDWNVKLRSSFSSAKAPDNSNSNDRSSNAQDIIGGFNAVPSDAVECSDSSVAARLSADCDLAELRSSRDSASVTLSESELFDCLVWEGWEDDC